MTEDSFESRARALDPVQYKSFRQAVETRKWPDGRRVTNEQLELMLQAIILYEQKNVPREKQSGYMPDHCKSSVSTAGADSHNRGGDKALIARTSSADVPGSGQS